MKFYCVFLLIIISSVCTYAQDIEYYTPENEQDIFIQSSASQNDPIFKWAWEKPHYGYDYEVARQSSWLDPSSAGLAVIAYTRTRHEQDGDANSFSAYIAFRPFLLDFQSYSIALGVSYFGVIQDFDEPDNVANNENLGGGVVADIESQDLDFDLHYQSFNFSALLSVPAAGFQATLEIGYLRDQFRADMNNINVVTNIDAGGAAFIAEEDRYHFKNENESLYLSLELRKLFARNYFNSFSLLLYSNINLKREKQRSSAVVTLGVDANANNRIDAGEEAAGPVFLDNLINGDAVINGVAGSVDPQEDALNTNYVGAFLTSRLFTVPMGVEFLGETTGISIDNILGIEYGEGEIFGADIHGAALQAGGSLSFFDFFSITFVHIWYQNNDFDDEWNLTLTMGLYGPITPNASQAVSGGFRGGR